MVKRSVEKHGNSVQRDQRGQIASRFEASRQITVQLVVDAIVQVCLFVEFVLGFGGLLLGEERHDGFLIHNP